MPQRISRYQIQVFNDLASFFGTFWNKSEGQRIIALYVELLSANTYLALRSNKPGDQTVQTLKSVKPEGTVTFRKPVREDGAKIWQLIRACKPLDENSMYANLLQSDHFRDTCVVAEMDDMIVGWISAYLLPNDDNTVFVWQVAVSPKARGLGLGTRMLDALMMRDETQDSLRMQTTITLDNDASWALFRKFAKQKQADLGHEAHFTKDTHFQGEHATEHMVTITFRETARRAA